MQSSCLLKPVGRHELPLNLQKELTLSTVTAVALTDTLAFIGEGPVLRVYDRVHFLCLTTQQAFASQPIHGLAIHKLSEIHILALLWGGKHVCPILLEYDAGKIKIVDKQTIICSDWILHCAFQTFSINIGASCIEAAAITAHNALLRLALYHETRPNIASRIHIVLRALTEASRSMLYAASLYWVTPRCIVVAAGSALGDVIVWSLVVDTSSLSESSRSYIQTHYWFSGHDGSIFGTALFELEVGSGSLNSRLLLATCSDDRTIRIWNVSKVLHSIRTFDEFSTQQLSAVEGVINPADLTERKDQPLAPCITRAWGHLSRIWQVAFVKNDCSEGEAFMPLGLISVGEDATLQSWNLQVSQGETEDDLRGELSHVSTHGYHSGKNIWSFTFSARNQRYLECTTGGADGSVSTFTIGKCLGHFEAESMAIQKWECSEVISSLTMPYTSLTPLSKSEALKKEFFRDYSFVDDNVILTATNSGHVLVGTSESSIHTTHGISADPQARVSRYRWKMLCEISDLSSYSIIVGLPASKVGFVAGANGKVYCYNEEILHETPVFQTGSKVSSLFAQSIGHSIEGKTSNVPSNNQHKSSRELALLVVPLGSAMASLVLFEYAANAQFIIKRQPKRVIQIELRPEFIISAMLCQRISENTMAIFLGSRSGTVSKYLLHGVADAFPPLHQRCVQTVEFESFPFHQDAVTSFTWHRPASKQEHITDDAFLLTTGRDSSYAIHKISLQSTTELPQPVHRVNLPLGPNIEGFYASPGSRHLIFYGFKSKDFIVFNETTQTELLRIGCGGAHRIWAFQPQLAQGVRDAGTLIWTKASKLHISPGVSNTRHVLKSGGHGREIKACAVCPVLLNLGGHDSQIIATGAEDTNIRLFKYHFMRGDIEATQLEPVTVIRKHDTGIQQLQWSSNGHHLFSSGGCEEFNVWRIRSVPFAEIGVVCEATLPPVSLLPDLRIMGFDAISTTHEQPLSDLQGEEKIQFIICMVFSDSTIRRYLYTSSAYNPTFTLLQAGLYGSCCLTQVQHLHDLAVPSTDGKFVTAGTDGTITVWSYNDSRIHISTEPRNLRSIHRAKIHQSSIKCLGVVFLTRMLDGSNTYLIITGGDDNGLALTRLDVVPSSSNHSDAEHGAPLELNATTSTLLIPRAHVAAITALVPVTIPSSHAVDEQDHTSLPQLKIVTASNDQRIKIWNISVDLTKQGVDGISVERGGNVPTPIADIGSMDIFADKFSTGKQSPQTRLVVCGVGMDIWRI